MDSENHPEVDEKTGKSGYIVLGAGLAVVIIGAGIGYIYGGLQGAIGIGLLTLGIEMFVIGMLAASALSPLLVLGILSVPVATVGIIMIGFVGVSVDGQLVTPTGEVLGSPGSMNATFGEAYTWMPTVPITITFAGDTTNECITTTPLSRSVDICTEKQLVAPQVWTTDGGALQVRVNLQYRIKPTEAYNISTRIGGPQIWDSLMNAEVVPVVQQATQNCAEDSAYTELTTAQGRSGYSTCVQDTITSELEAMGLIVEHTNTNLTVIPIQIVPTDLQTG